MKPIRNLIFILGDRLSLRLSSLEHADQERDVVLMCDVIEEATYVQHHKKKIGLIFAAIRHFANELRATGLEVRYVKLDDPDNSGSFSNELARAVLALSPRRIVVTEASEWRVLQSMGGWRVFLEVPIDIRADTRFLCSKAEFRKWAEGRRSLTMEYFYRGMRNKTGLLMQGNDPEGSRWNFDMENRKPAKPDLFRPKHQIFTPDASTIEVLALIERDFAGNMGSTKNFSFAVTRCDAEQAARSFIQAFLPNFGETRMRC